MGWFHLFSKIKVVSNNFLSEQTVGWLIILGRVVNRGFLQHTGCAAWLLLLGGFQNCWYFTRLSLSSHWDKSCASRAGLAQEQLRRCPQKWTPRQRGGDFEAKLIFLLTQTFKNLHFQGQAWVGYEHWNHWWDVQLWSEHPSFGAAEKVFAWSSPACFPLLL